MCVRAALHHASPHPPWHRPPALSLVPHALAPVADLPVREVVSATHLVADLIRGLGHVVHDDLA